MSDTILTNKAMRNSIPLSEIDFEEVNDFLCLDGFTVLLCTMLQAKSIGIYIQMFMYQHMTTISVAFSKTQL